MVEDILKVGAVEEAPVAEAPIEEAPVYAEDCDCPNESAE